VKALQNCFNAIANSVVPDFKEAVLLYSQFMDSRFIGRIPKEQFEKINGFFKNFLKHENENDTIQSFASSVIQRFPRYVLFAQDFARDVPFLQPGCTLDIQPLRDSTKAINEMIRRDETKVLAEHMQSKHSKIPPILIKIKRLNRF
jgi:hypothetical protein